MIYPIVSTVIDSHRSDLIDSLYPFTVVPTPLAWLEVAGALSLLCLEVKYVRTRKPHELVVSVMMKVPVIGDDRFGVVVSNQIVDLSRHADPRQPVLDLVRNLVLHEILEGLRVDGAPFYKAEVDRDHGR